MKRAHFYWVIVLLLLGACQSISPGTRPQKIAASFCECTQKLTKLNQQAEAARSDSTQTTKFQELIRLIQEEYDKVKDCTAGLETQYGKLEEPELLQVEQALTECNDGPSQRNLLRELLAK